MGMMRKFVVACVFAGLTQTAMAQDIPYIKCVGSDPGWAMDILGDTSQFRFAERTIDFDIPDVTQGSPGPWPVALTMIARGETAIVILRPNEGGFAADILTQHRQLPVLFTGTCAPF